MKYPIGHLIVSFLGMAILLVSIKLRQRREARKSPVGHILSGPLDLYIDGMPFGLEDKPIIDWPTRPQEFTLDYTPLGPVDENSFLYWFFEFTWAHNQYVRRTFNTYGPAYHRATTETRYND